MQKFWELMLWHIYGIDTLEYVGYYFQAKICFSKKKNMFLKLFILYCSHSSILAWRIPWTEEPGGLQSMGSRTRLSD